MDSMKFAVIIASKNQQLELQNLEEAVLLDMLAAYTSQYTRLFNESPSSKEYFDCKIVVDAIIEEFRRRKPDTHSALLNDFKLPGLQ
jgi:hypothetical protein